MARKSRKTQVRNKPVAEVKKEAAALPTAIYARLSVENSGKDDDGNSLQNQIAVCKDYLEGCPYENFSGGGLTKDAYLKQRAEIDSKIASAKAEQDSQEQLLGELERLAFQDKAREDDVFTAYDGATELTAELAGTFIKEILVSSPTEIEIIWKFRDVFEG